VTLPTTFEALFELATGYRPYAYQRELAAATPPPDVLRVPTGSGKTQALLVAWMHERLVAQRGPRRLVYALPMRTLVEQTVGVATELRARVGLAEGELPIHVLMGGEEQYGDWRTSPERPQIIIGTIDMLLSRGLNRGYAESRFAWPIACGLLHNDCRWVFDEVQLMGPARATSAQLDGLRSKLGTVLPSETVWVSATVDEDALRTFDRPQLGRSLALPASDRDGPLARRLNAPKTLERMDVAGLKASSVSRAIADEVTHRHAPGSRTLIVVNTVERAQRTAQQLWKLVGSGETEPAVVLLHSRFRPPDRLAHMVAATREPNRAGTIVVATQVVEAGVDMSSSLLVSETAPFSSVVQRLGRLNRAGELCNARMLWLDGGGLELGQKGAKAAAPYAPEDLNAARSALLTRVGGELSPAALESLDVFEQADDPTVIRRRDLLDLFDTTPDLSGMDIDIAPFIREDGERNVTVFFRALSGGQAEPSKQPAPLRDELIQVPLGGFGKRALWRFDHVEGDWERINASGVSPGATLMLDGAEGGYEPTIGWDSNSRAAVDPVFIPVETMPPESFGSDSLSTGSEPQLLLDHLLAAEEQAKVLVEGLELSDRLGTAVIDAAALHDIGKAHATFQQTLRAAIGLPESDGRLWAKSGSRGGRHARRHLRHELASALVLRSLEGHPASRNDSLTIYLIAAHHGKVRLSIRPAPNERPPADAGPRARFAFGNARRRPPPRDRHPARSPARVDDRSDVHGARGGLLVDRGVARSARRCRAFSSGILGGACANRGLEGECLTSALRAATHGRLSTTSRPSGCCGS